jgi:hypothetical protein
MLGMMGVEFLEQAAARRTLSKRLLIRRTLT